MNLTKPLLYLIVLCASSASWSATFIVTSRFDDNLAHDVNPGDGVCADSVGVCTLRAAIQEANTDTAFDIILFDNTLAGLQITLAASEGPLPVITEGTALLANLMSAYNDDATLLRNAPPQITLNGGNLASNSVGLLFSGAAAQGSVVAGLSIVSFPSHGIQAAFGADDLDIDRNYIGALPDFTQAGNGGHGISIVNSSDHRIGKARLMNGSGFSGLGNVVSSNGMSGIRLESSDNTTIHANLIGIRPSGTNARGNDQFGIHVSGSGHTIGDVAGGDAAGNFIASNGLGGILLSGSDHEVYANTLGMGETGTFLSSPGNGVTVVGDGHTLGQSGDAANNIYAHLGSAVRLGINAGNMANNTLISGNQIGRFGLFGVTESGNANGIHIANGTLNEIIGNRIINSVGNTDLGLTADGVFVRSDNNRISENQIGFVNTIGGPSAQPNAIGIDVRGDMNTVSDNQVGGNEDEGLLLEGDEFRVFGNHIGVTDDFQPIGNQDIGINMVNGDDNDVFDNVVGDNLFSGMAMGAIRTSMINFNFIGISPDGDVIGNGNHGIRMSLGRDNTLGANRIAHNGRRGIMILDDSERIEMIANQLHSNLIFGIDLNADLASANDPGDPDELANRTQNHPVLESAFLDNTRGIRQLVAEYRIDTDADNASYPLKVDFFWTPFDEPAQGRFYLQTDLDYLTPNTLREFSINFPLSASGGWLTATARDQVGNSSEMSERIVFGNPGFIFQDGFE